MSKPLILIASAESWLVRALESALGDAGFRLTTALDEPKTLDVAQSERPHGILLDTGLAPPDYGVCRALRTISIATPIILIRPGHVSAKDRRQGLRAGAWDMRGTPLDFDDLTLTLRAFVEAKVELERVSDECLVDLVSGLYNPAGLHRRGEELAALATRRGTALACAVFRGEGNGDRLAKTFRILGRRSDAVGRTGPTEFAVFAPATDGFAAARLVRRMTPPGMRAGYSAVGARQRISPTALLSLARKALR